MELRPILETPSSTDRTLTLTASGAGFRRGLQVPLLESVLTSMALERHQSHRALIPDFTAVLF
jgi:hypothetical protein